MCWGVAGYLRLCPTWPLHEDFLRDARERCVTRDAVGVMSEAAGLGGAAKGVSNGRRGYTQLPSRSMLNVSGTRLTCLVVSGMPRSALPLALNASKCMQIESVDVSSPVLFSAHFGGCDKLKDVPAITRTLKAAPSWIEEAGGYLYTPAAVSAPSFP